MKTTAAAMVILMIPAGAVAEPKVLSGFELDRITAGGVLVDVASGAVAFGGRLRTLTDANTFVVVGRSYDLGVGLTLGHGYACCGDEADVEVDSMVFGVGDIVHRGIRALKYDDGISAQGLSSGYVVAVSFREPLLRFRELPPTPAAVRGRSRDSVAR